MVFFSYIFASETVREGDLIKSTAPRMFVEASAIALYDTTRASPRTQVRSFYSPGLTM